ncbi:hypothetical protein [Calothrix sp. NIES-2098]|uniref:hypothetical protein n=1 Tax=Calothrix sp. NIES-2098 TaxID=1954171 RepID=UPI000B5DF282|nr:hypothetical protein NIES2098_34650 [Calothrix sp. NIES-2098]
MTKKCYYITYVNCAGASGSGYFCSESITYVPTGGGCGGGYFVSPDLGFNSANASELSGTVEEVSCSFCPGCCTDPKYDCLNGSCVSASTYGTPGVFSSLSACESQCSANGNCGDGKVCADANYCPPGMVCIENQEYSEIQGLMHQLNSDLS